MTKVGYKKPPKEYQIKPGQVLNPEGGRSHGPGRLSTVFKKLTAKQVSRIGSLLFNGTEADLVRVVEDVNETNIMRWTARMMLKGLRKGELHKYEVLLDRFVGSVEQKIKHKGLPETQNASAVIVTIPANGYGAEEKLKSDKPVLPKP